MKTIIHLVLSDLERNHLACVWDDNYSQRMVTRSEVIARVETHIEGEVAQYVRNNDTPDEGRGGDTPTPEVERRSGGLPEADSGDSSSVGSLPSAKELGAACRAVLDHIALNEETDTINPGWCCSRLAQTGAI